ncbi:aminotransferase class V [Chloroherpeton thalassium ATCC 35110]|uniref:Aminotransferase class V n=1 Tax=Chloroherpeton thalassium (strain ATCC 35110 / GB-78) TaxID=517418 RepID=B3QUY7_CHLT3|nr:aminotransferase class V-fold PLP-dependent enzyme [Chloroherpeton thalassium]ACF14488.1 aminotransferase class V [Chloroherpeton thalassium ATCC 35110]
MSENTSLSPKEILSQTDAYRNLFPHTKRGDIYLNHAAVSPLSLPVKNAIQAHLEERSELDIENYFSTLAPALQSARARVSSWIGCKSENLAFVPNTSYGINLLAQGLSWKSGDRVLLYDKEFPANVYPFLALQKKGVKVDFFSDRNGEILLEDIAKKLTPETRLLSISFVQFLSGFRIDLAAIAALCHKHDVLCAVDGIQGLGAFAIDCEESGIDFLSSGCHKWAMSPMGIGIIYVSDQLLAELDPVFTGWLSVENAWEMLDYKLDLPHSARRYELGTINWMGIIGLNEAFGLFREIGQPVLSQKILLLSEHLRQKLQEAGFELALQTGKDHLSGITSVANLEAAEQIVTELANRNIEVSMRDGFLRIAPHFYNTIDELTHFVEELKTIDIAP